MKKSVPVNYNRIYRDIITKKFPEKADSCEKLLTNKSLSALDIIEINEKIFGKPDQETFHDNQQLRSYTKSSILKILDYQKKHNLSNMKTAEHFRLSRNSISKWKKQFY
ncbi:helix-turn-helix domain-containing protein [uncultured Chryseobacterium sp.]|uniref:helix-turn-helix domain-containing protein n=1 Tax=uncultured Chryseobacterium sp. TaxID=259322 RepID=UPI0025D3E92D|nr:helix-turn-helix domain-containing protein [uncultured Chryseobacterium sp.]